MLSIFKNNKKGFTLIELLVVIAIIGVLASIVLVSLNNARVKARDTRRISDIKNIQLALELYYDSNVKYPTVLSGVGGLDQATSCGSQKCMTTVPTDPTSAAAYTYNSPSGNLSYHLGATLEETDGPITKNDADDTTGFQGKSADCGATATATDSCYDVTQ